MVCQECGAGARDGANFCLNCGAPLSAEDSLEATEAAASATPAAPRDDVDTDPGGPDPAGPGASDPYIADQATRPVPAVSDEPTVQDAGLQDCPNCGAPNSELRTRCGRCGVDLATGTLPPGARRRRRPASSGAPDEDTGPLPTQRGRGIRPLHLLLGAGALLGAIIGGLAAAEVGPFDDGPSVPVAVFDPGVYVGTSRPLDVERVLASSTHAPQDDNRYDASRVADGDLTTAWNSDGTVRPNGVGETLRLDLERPAWVDELVIGNGYQKDDRAFVANARAKRLRISLGGTQVFDVSVADRPGRQVVTLPSPVLTTQVTIVVLEAYEGDTYRDLALSELEVKGWAAVGRDLDLIAPTDVEAEPTGSDG